MNEIVRGLWQGGVSSLTEASQFDLVVLCALEVQPGTPYYSEVTRGQNMPPELRCPMDDVAPGRADDRIRATWAAHQVAKRMARQERVLVTCFAGRNRSGLVSALALVMLGASSSAAIRRVRAARPNALTNDAFVKWIEQRQTQHGRHAVRVA